MRFNPMGSDEGGLEELVELSLSRPSRSLMRRSSSRTRPLTESKTARMAIWASGGTVFQSGSGMGGRGIILLILRAYYTKSSARERVRLPLKKKSPHASERDTPEVQQERGEFVEEVEPIEPRRLVFVDETGVTTAMTPAYGRAPSGERVESSAPASWESVTVIAAIGLDGVRAPLAFEGAVNAPTFLAYVERILVPALDRGDVVIFDNLTSHLSPEVTAAIERAGATVLPLPPYSPDFNPIEEMFSKFKEFLRRVGARAKEHLYDAIGDGLREVTPQDILGWFRHAGMCVMQA